MKTGFSLRNITTRTTLPDGSTLTSGQYGPAVSATYPLGTYVEDYEWLASNSGDIDRYNGRLCVTPEYPNGTYAYFVTLNASGTPEFPYIIGPQYYGAPEMDNITMGTVISIPGGVTCFTTSSVPTGIDNPEKQSTASLYPNPNNGKFNISLPETPGTKKISIFDLQGKEVYSLTTTEDLIGVDLSETTGRGVFVLKVLSDGREFTTKIVLD